MVIGLFGESCTGKSTLANEIATKIGAKVYTGKDYMRLAKNEAEAQKLFIDLLQANEATDEVFIYVISEKEHLAFLPEKAIRVLVTADIAVIKERFANRMNGKLPPPVATMLEKKHGSFNAEKYDFHVDNVGNDISDVCDRIVALGKK